MLRKLARCSIFGHHPRKLLCSSSGSSRKRHWMFHLASWREHYYRVVFILLSCLLLLQYGFNVFVIRRQYLLTNFIGSYVVGNRTEQREGDGTVGWGDRTQKVLQFLLRPPAVAEPLPLCPEVPPGLVGAIPVTFEKPTLQEMEDTHLELEPGGRWIPSNCTARHKVALIVPYRDREHHLRIFINHIHPFLQKQQLDYGIYLIEQTATATFNRAMLLNIGFVEARKDYDYECYIFHDVDLLPEDDRNLYSCPSQPRHMAAYVDTLAYRLPYDNVFGGIEAFSREHFELVNGFSNKFFGWGAEDDDMFNRMQHHDLVIIRYPREIARYKMIRHMKQYPSSKRFKYLYTGKLRFEHDGINNLKYTVIERQKSRLFTRIHVNISEEQVLAEDRELMMLADLAPQYREAIIGAEVAAQQMSNVMGEGIIPEYRGGGLLQDSDAPSKEGPDGSDTLSEEQQNIVPLKNQTADSNTQISETENVLTVVSPKGDLVKQSLHTNKAPTQSKQSESDLIHHQGAVEESPTVSKTTSVNRRTGRRNRLLRELYNRPNRHFETSEPQRVPPKMTSNHKKVSPSHSSQMPVGGRLTQSRLYRI